MWDGTETRCQSYNSLAKPQKAPWKPLHGASPPKVHKTLALGCSEDVLCQGHPPPGGTHLSISLRCPLWEGLSSTWVTPTQVPSTSCVPKRLPPGWRGHPSGPTPPTKLQGLAETPAPHPRARRSERRGRAIPDKNKEARKGVFLLGNNTSQKLHGEAKTTPRPKPPERVWALYNDSPTPSTSDDN